MTRSFNLPAVALRGLSLLMFACVLACGGESKSESMRSVVLICLDSVRADHLGAYGYELRSTTPELDQLAGKSTLYREASASAMGVGSSVASILSGTYPIEHGLYARGGASSEARSSLPDDVNTLAEAFRDQGCATAAFVANRELRKGLGFEQGFDSYTDGLGSARAIFENASDWLDAQDEEPVFLFLQVALPLELDTDAKGSGDGETLEARVADYDAALGALDQELGVFLGRIEGRSSQEQAIVCVVASRGAELLELESFGPGVDSNLVQTLLHVPWILHVPGETPRAVDTPCSLVDLYPTLLSAAGAKASEINSGVDRFRHPDIKRPALAEHLDVRGYQQSMRFGDRKVLRHLRWPTNVNPLAPGLLLATLEQEATTGRLDGVEESYESYHLGKDPHETTRLSSAEVGAAFEKSVGHQFRDLLGRRKWFAER